MKHLKRLLSLEDIADGKAIREKEVELYVYLEDLSALNKAASMDHQEQWAVKVEKTDKNAKGSIRVRKVVSGGDKSIQYVLTAKADIDTGDRMEVPTPVTEDMFNVFKTIATSGMVKDRYYFPIEGTNLTWEVDVFFDEKGNYHNWLKIDLENCGGKAPPLPFVVSERIDGQTEDPAEREKIRELYSKYFLSSQATK
jgi:CYTH domain-containing protein